MINFAAFGNDLYTGKRSIDFVGRHRRWYALSGLFILLAALGLTLHGLNLSLEFRGGSSSGSRASAPPPTTRHGPRPRSTPSAPPALPR